MWDILVWYLTLFLIGIITIPCGLFLFKDLDDYAYPVYKIIGIGLVSYLVWIQGILKIVPFGLSSIIIAFIILFLISGLCTLRGGVCLTKIFLKKAILYEGIFLSLFSILVFYKLYHSDISNIEKFMDYGFLNAILRTDFFPAKDPWFSQGTMNYYYFGHLVTAVLTKLTGIKSAITFNLMQVTVFVLFITGIFSIGYNLTKKYLFATFTTLLAAFVGINMPLGESGFRLGGNSVIPGTINEFPIYTFVLGELHAHYMDLPFIVLILISFYLYFVKKAEHFSLKILMSFTLGLMFMTNSWDYLIYSSIFVLLNIFKNLKKSEFAKTKDILLVGATSFAVFLPFYLDFQPASRVFKLVTVEKTTIRDFLLIFGVQFLVIGFYLLYRFLREQGKLKKIIFFLGILSGVILFFFSQIAGLVAFLTSTLIFISHGTYEKNKHTRELLFINTLIFISFAIILFCEFFYLKDIYLDNWQRGNTVFKFYYNLWIIMSVVTGYLFWHFSILRSKIKYAFFILVFSFLLFKSSAVFDIFYFFGKEQTEKKGLDGSKYLSEVLPYDYKAIEWINSNIKDNYVIAEAPGQIYTTDSRVSSYTGLATPIGWFGHEWGWRNNPRELTFVRDDMDKLFTSESEKKARLLIGEYNIKYIFYGEKEREKYKNPGWIVPKIFEKVYQSEKVEIYKVK